MARPFSVEAASSRFNLPRETREQIRALILDLDMDARDIVILAVAQLHQREIGEPERDLAAELDELKARLDKIEAWRGKSGGTRRTRRSGRSSGRSSLRRSTNWTSRSFCRAPASGRRGRKTDMNYYVDKGTETITIPDDCFLVRFSGQHWLAGQRGRRVVYAALRRGTEYVRTEEEILAHGGRLAPAWGDAGRLFGEVIEVFATNSQWRTAWWPQNQVAHALAAIDLTGLLIYELPQAAA